MVAIIGTRLCVHTKSHCAVPSEWVNCAAWELYLSKTMKKIPGGWHLLGRGRREQVVLDAQAP